jgi:hypothetical protein
VSSATLAALEAKYPEIFWREPIRIAMAGLGSGYFCRVCIAAEGLSRVNFRAAVFENREGFAAHLAEEHLAPG